MLCITRRTLHSIYDICENLIVPENNFEPQPPQKNKLKFKAEKLMTSNNIALCVEVEFNTTNSRELRLNMVFSNKFSEFQPY